MASPRPPLPPAAATDAATDAAGTRPGTTVRPLAPADVEAATGVFRASIEDLVERLHHPAAPWTPARTASTASRIALLRSTDPDGSFVAEVGGEIVGLAQAAQRDELWNLCHFFVAPKAQNQGVGGALMAAVLAYGSRDGRGAITSTPDPRAMRHYVRAGFDLHPTVIGFGAPHDHVRAGRVAMPAMAARTSGIRPATEGDLPAIAPIDRAVRGAARTSDLAGLLAAGDRLLVLPDRGYVALRGNRVATLAALDEDDAVALLVAGVVTLAAVHDNVEITRMLGNQQWALRTTTELGIELHPHGPLMLRGWGPPSLPFLPDASLC